MNCGFRDGEMCSMPPIGASWPTKLRILEVVLGQNEPSERRPTKRQTSTPHSCEVAWRKRRLLNGMLIQTMYPWGVTLPRDSQTVSKDSSQLSVSSERMESSCTPRGLHSNW